MGASPSGQNGKGHSWQSVQPGQRPRILKEPMLLESYRQSFQLGQGIRSGGPGERTGWLKLDLPPLATTAPSISYLGYWQWPPHQPPFSTLQPLSPPIKM